MFGSIFLCEGRRYVLLGAFSSSQAQLVVSISHTLLWLETWGAICQAAVSERMSLEAEVVICVFSGLLRKKTTTENTQNSINSTASLRKKKKKHQLVSSRCQPASSCCVHLPFQKWLRGHLSVDFFRRCPAQKCTALLLTFFTQAGHAIHEPHPGQHWHLPTALRINSIRASLLFRVITTLPEPSES